MPWAVNEKKEIFVGKRSLKILKEKKIRTLVGFTLASRNGETLPDECNLVIDENEICGRVTSVSESPTLSCIIGMAYVDDKTLKRGGNIFIRKNDGVLVEAKVEALPFYDPKGLRQKLGPAEG